MEVLKRRLVSMRASPVIEMDKELALVNAINGVFLCRLRLNKKVLKNLTLHSNEY